MVVHSCSEHNRFVKLIEYFIVTNTTTKENQTEELKVYFSELERKCQQGCFEEISDAIMRKWNERD